MNEIELPFKAEVPFLDQYLGLWFMAPEVLQQKYDLLASMNIQLHLSSVMDRALEKTEAPKMEAGQSSARRIGYGYNLDKNGIALVGLQGVLMKQETSAEPSTSTVKIRRDIRNAKDDDECEGLMLFVESPGGTMNGIFELADDVAEFAKVKPAATFGCDTIASAAYLVGAQTGVISSNRSAIVGSIGTKLSLIDSSAAAKMRGYRVVTIDSTHGKGMKSAATPGTEITPEQVAYFQKIVDAGQAQFNDAVIRTGRFNKEKMAEMADGRVHPAPDALSMGLIDRVESYDQAMENLVSRVKQNPKRKTTVSVSRGMRQEIENTPTQTVEPEPQTVAEVSAAQPAEAVAEAKEILMAETTSAAAKPATPAELKAAFPKDPQFCLDCLEKNLSLLESKAAYTDVLQARLAEADKRAGDAELAQAKAEQTAREVAKPPTKIGGQGVAGKISPTAEIDGDPKLMFPLKVTEYLKAHNISRLDATKKVVHELPELHEAYLDATNPTKRGQTMLEECREDIVNWGPKPKRA